MIASFAVSGAHTLAALDANSIFATSATGGHVYRFGATLLLTNVTPGTNTFTMKYKVGSGTGNFANRHISVKALDI